MSEKTVPEVKEIEYICLHPRNKTGLCNKQDCQNKIILEDWEHCFEQCSDRAEYPTAPHRKCLADTCEHFNNCPFNHDKTACEMNAYEIDQDLDLTEILAEASK